MAGYEKLASELQSLVERTATSRPVAAKAVDKLAIGRDFKASNLTVTQPLAEGDILIRHNPEDGNDIQIRQHASDNTLRIHDASTGNTSGWFYPDGRAWFDFLDGTVESRHVLNLAGSKIDNQSLTSGKYALLSVGFGQLANDSIGDQKVYEDGIKSIHIANTNVLYAHMNSNTKDESQGTSSMRSIQTLLGGSSVQASAGNHAHLSVNFNSLYTLDEKEASASLVTQVRGMRQQQQHGNLYPLIDLVLDLAHQNMDEPDHDVVEKVRRLKEDRVYAHEFRMKHDAKYYAAWAIDHVPEYAEKVRDDSRIQQMAAHAREVYTRIEDAPKIVEDYKHRKGPFA